MKINIRQLQWLLLACFCVVFSGAVKKVIQLHADRKIKALTHTENIDGRFAPQNLKDGHRERHEFLTIVLSDKKQFSPLPSFEPSSHLPLLFANPVFLNLHKWACVSLTCHSDRFLTVVFIPIYLLIHNLRI